MNATEDLADDTKSEALDVMAIVHCLIASVGIISNSTVVFAFLNHKKLCGKIPNMFIINQVRQGLLICTQKVTETIVSTLEKGFKFMRRGIN